MSYRAAFGRALRDWRLARGWTLVKLSAILRRRGKGRGPSEKTIGQWELGDHMPLPKWMPDLLRLGFVPPPRPQPSLPNHLRFQ